MVASLSIRDDRDLAQKIFSRYLHSERKYDAWGAQGKVLVLREILAEEGFDIPQLVSIGVKFQKLVNLVFPRTFFSHPEKVNIPDLDQNVIEYYREVKLHLTLQGIDELKMSQVAIEETSSKFAIESEQVKDI